jgi:hypothetical protein
MYDRLIKHIQINNIPVKEQFGFTTSSSTEKAAFKLVVLSLSLFVIHNKYYFKLYSKIRSINTRTISYIQSTTISFDNLPKKNILFWK